MAWESVSLFLNPKSNDIRLRKDLISINKGEDF